MTHANIFMLIDLEETFGEKELNELYVPGGEKAGEIAADLINHAENSVFVHSQDFHPADHISFFSNHSGVKPFQDIYVKQGADERYRAVAAEIGGRAVAVDTDGRGYITHVRNRAASPQALDGAFKTTLWWPHGKQGEQGSLFLKPVMEALPAKLVEKLRTDMTSLTLHAEDHRGNDHYVVRKGHRPDLHSYGIATEDDRVTKTAALKTFEEIAQKLAARGVTNTDIYIGGLATNYCVEFSHADIYSDFIPILKKHGIAAKVHLLTDISYGIPASTPDGSWPDLEAAPRRMAAFGTGTETAGHLVRRMTKPFGGAEADFGYELR